MSTCRGATSASSTVLEGQNPQDCRSDTFDLTPNHNGKVQDIDVPTFDIQNIDVNIVEVDLLKQLILCKLTI